MKNYILKKSGSAFIVVIGILGIIIFAATMFMTSTIEEGKQTSMSIRGLHTSSLAEASLERAMRILSEKINNVDPEKSSNDDLGIILRLPATESSSNMGLSDNFGVDNELTLNDTMKKEILLTEADLKIGDKNDLEDLVNYMTDNGTKSYSVKIKAYISKAFRNSPGKKYKDFKVPGVDIGWNLRYDVEKFLSGEGYTAFEVKIPEKWSWLDISIPVQIGPFKICDINVTAILNKLIPDIGGYSFEELTSIDFLADFIINKVIGKRIGKSDLYPFKFKFEKLTNKIPKTVQALWPSGVAITEADNQYIEKYGQITFECEASITYNDNYTSTRRITAVKDFKVADCEPPAPMYSFFINNLHNDYIFFNNYGGQFYVNSYDYSGIFGKIKESILGTNNLTEEEVEEREYPGLIRVNYVDKSSNKDAPLLCNAGLVGDWGDGVRELEGEESSTLNKVANGIEAAIVVCNRSEMTAVGAEYNLASEIKRKDPKTGEKVPVNLLGPEKGEKAKFALGGKVKDYSIDMPKLTNDQKLKLFDTAFNKINLIPNVAKMSTNIIGLTITLALLPMVNTVTNALNMSDILNVNDCFQKWEMPYMGTDWRYYTMPTTGTANNKSHLFGYAGLHPTMTKEIEGNVMKVYRQWAMCIVGMKASDRLPLLPFFPYKLPPLPIPIWKTAYVLKKYGYNFEGLRANDDSGHPDTTVHEYDPELVENMAPNLYTSEQYAKKATYYYSSPDEFIKDLPNRTTKSGDKTVFLLNGITFISGTLGSDGSPFKATEGDTFYVTGKGMIIVSGNIFLGSNVVALDGEEKTVFTLMSRNGGLIINDNLKLRIEGSLYTEYGIYIPSTSSLHIVGNWVTNTFNKMVMGGTIVVDYVSSRVRTSLGSLHPTRGKYDPRRYFVTFSPTWSSWRSH